MFQNAQQARDWLKELGYPVQESLVFSAPPLPKSAAEHIEEWALLAAVKEESGLPLHIYWLHAVPEANLNDIKYVAHVCRFKYPNVHPLFLARYRSHQQWRSVLICPNYESPRNRWASGLYFKITSSEEIATLLRYDPSVPVEKHWQRIYAALRGEPMSVRVQQVLESCIAELENILSDLKTRAKQAVDEEDEEQGQRLLQEAKSVRQLIEQVKQLAAGAPLKPTHAPQSIDQSRTRQKYQRQRRATPESSYHLPILESLVELGGSASVGAVLDRVYEKISGTLQAADKALVPSGQEPRWRNTAKWARADLKTRGYIASDTPHGIWAITEKGREYLEALKRDSS
ncbi:MAG: winged helix-turn-helix domain-containing protein [Fimbriimonadales bacterium]